jgi:hypothetical protein
MSENKSDICAKFSHVFWHDSELLNVHILRDSEKNQYDLRLDLNVITGFSEGRTETSRKTAVFSDCRIVRADFDLLGVLLCRGAIAAGVCYEDAVELERRKRDKAQEFDLPDSYNGLAECLGFLIDMIHPGGEITIFARDFELISPTA